MSVTVIANAAYAGTITLTGSNDGSAWISLDRVYSTLASVLVSTVTLSASQTTILVIPAITRFVRLQTTAYTSGQANMTAYLRTTPVPFQLVSPQTVNVTQLNGSPMVSSGVVGVQSVGGNVAPGFVRTANPIPIAGTDSTNITRSLRTDASGRVAIAGVDTLGAERSIQVLRSNNYSGASIAVQDLSATEGSTNSELLTKVLLELRILNLQINELPLSLNSGIPTTDNLDGYRNDPSMFNS